VTLSIPPFHGNSRKLHHADARAWQRDEKMPVGNRLLASTDAADKMRLYR